MNDAGGKAMSIRQFFNKYFSKYQETKDDHWDPFLQTRYYKTTFDRGFDHLLHMVENSPEFEKKAASKDYGEISFYLTKGRKTFIIATVMMHKPYETSIDFTASSEGISPIDFGHTRKVIHMLYERLNKELPLIESKAGR